jgi:selenocysteine-specific elongation factor
VVSASLLSGATLQQLLERTGFPSKRVEALLSPLLSSGELVQVLREPRTFLSRNSFEQLKSHITKELAGYCAENRLKEGVSKEELKTRIPRRSDQRFFAACLTALEKEGKVLLDRELVKPAERSSTLSAGESDIRQKIIHSLASSGIEPPTPKELALMLGSHEKGVLDHLNLLARAGLVAKVKGDLFYYPEALEILRGKLVGFLSERKEITPAEFRELTGLSRKFMIPVLEYFDAQKITIRVGDKRIMRGAQGQMPNY